MSDELLRAVTWGELADLYDKEHSGGRPARTLPMDTVFGWAERQPDRFTVSESGELYLIRGRSHD